MTGFNYPRIYKKAHDLITRFGATGYLRRAGTDRAIRCVLIEWTPHEREVVIEGSSRALISRLDPATRAKLEVPPDHELDVLVFAGKIYNLVSPDTGPRPNGEPVFHEYQVLYTSAA